MLNRKRCISDTWLSSRIFIFACTFNPLQDELFRGCSLIWKGGGDRKAPIPKICHTYPTMMKLGTVVPPKEDSKNIWIMWHILWVLLTSAFFHQKSANFAYQEIQIEIAFWYIISNSFNFPRVFKFWWCQQKWLPQAFIK